MRRFATALTAWLIALSLHGCSLAGLWGDHLDTESRTFVDEAIPAVVAEWDVEELVARGTPELGRYPLRQQLVDIFFLYRRLGKLTKYEGATGEATIALNSRQGLVITAQYVATASFEAGKATINTVLVKQHGAWRIAGMQVNSPILTATADQDRDDKPAPPAPTKQPSLEARVATLLEGDDVQLRAHVADVFELAQRHAQGGEAAEAIRLYRRGVKVAAGDLDAQLALAHLLQTTGATDEAVAKARMVAERAETEEQITAAEALLARLGAPAAPATAPPAISPNVEITLVPLGNPSDRLLRTVRDRLRAYLGINFVITDQTMALGSPDRTWATPYVAQLYRSVYEALSPSQIEQIEDELDLGEDDLTEETNRLRFIRATLDKEGESGKTARAKLSATLRDLRSHPQYDTSRLLAEMRRRFPLPLSETNKGYLAVTEADIYEDDDHFRFGASLPRYAIVSYHRFSAAFNHDYPNRPRLIERTFKQAVSSTMFVLGFPRCDDPNCVRVYPHSLAEHDAKPALLCGNCRQTLDRYKVRLTANRDAGLRERKAGDALLAKGKVEEAITSYRRSIAANPNRFYAHYRLGRALQKAGDLDGLIEAFRNASRIEPRLAEPYHAIGVAYGGQGKFEKAINSLKSAAALAPDAIIRNDLGYSYYRAKQYLKAIVALQRAVEVDDSLAIGHYNLALVYFATQAWQRAASECNRAIALGYRADPRFVQALNRVRRGAVTPSN